MVRSGEKSLLIECGLPWKQAQIGLNFETSNLSGCLVSHVHGDHIKAAREFMKAGVDVYATKETFEGYFKDKPCIHQHRMKDLIYGTNRIIDGWYVYTFETKHDCDGSAGFYIREPGHNGESLLFLTDTGYCKYIFPPATIYMIEANFSEKILSKNVEHGFIDPPRAKRVRENHFSIERVVELLKKNDLSMCREIRLLHLSSGNSSEDMFKRAVQETTGIYTTVEKE